MTREEALKKAINIVAYFEAHFAKSKEAREDAANIIEALEQEPCEDAISRQAVLDAMYELCNTGETLKDNPWRDNPHIDAVTDTINNLPSVNPQEPKYCDRNICIKNEYNGIGCDECEVTKSQKPKTGHWIVHPKGIYAHLVCDKCLSSAPYDCKTNYCPNCGAKMVKAESEET